MIPVSLYLGREGFAFAHLRLDTIRNSGPALHLFEKHGFVEIPRYNENPDADLFMELDLGRSDLVGTPSQPVTSPSA